MAILDASGEPWVQLVRTVEHRVAELTRGDAAEVVSTEPEIRCRLGEWCRRRGHELAVVEERGGVRLLVIKH